MDTLNDNSAKLNDNIGTNLEVSNEENVINYDCDEANFVSKQNSASSIEMYVKAIFSNDSKTFGRISETLISSDAKEPLEKPIENKTDYLNKEPSIKSMHSGKRKRSPLNKSEAKITDDTIYNLNEIPNDNLQSFIRLLGQSPCLWSGDTSVSLSERREAYFLLLSKLKQSITNATFRDVYDIMRQLSVMCNKSDLLDAPRILRSNEKDKRNRMILDELALLKSSFLHSKMRFRNYVCTFCSLSFYSHNLLWKHMIKSHLPSEEDQTLHNDSVQDVTDEELCRDFFNVPENFKKDVVNSKSPNATENNNVEECVPLKRKRGRPNRSTLKVTSKDILSNCLDNNDAETILQGPNFLNEQKECNEYQKVSKIALKGKKSYNLRKSELLEKVNNLDCNQEENMDCENNNSEDEVVDDEIDDNTNAEVINNSQKKNKSNRITKRKLCRAGGRCLDTKSRTTLKINKIKKNIRKHSFHNKNANLCTKKLNSLDKVALLEETTKTILAFERDIKATHLNDYDDKFFQEFFKACRQYPSLWCQDLNSAGFVREHKESLRGLADVYNKLMPCKPIIHLNQLHLFLRRLRNYYERYLVLRNEAVNQLIPRSNIWQKMMFFDKTSSKEDGKRLNMEQTSSNLAKTTEDLKGNQKRNVFSCAKCNRIYKISKRLAYHMKIKHPLTNCFCCKKDFRNADKLKKHVIDHHINEEKCPLCPLMHLNKNSMASRQRKWYGDKHLSKHFHNFYCMLCEKAFHDYTNYINHFKRCKGYMRPGKIKKNAKPAKNKNAPQTHKLKIEDKPVINCDQGHLKIVGQY